MSSVRHPEKEPTEKKPTKQSTGSITQGLGMFSKRSDEDDEKYPLTIVNHKVPDVFITAPNSEEAHALEQKFDEENIEVILSNPRNAW